MFDTECLLKKTSEVIKAKLNGEIALIDTEKADYELDPINDEAWYFQNLDDEAFSYANFLVWGMYDNPTQTDSQENNAIKKVDMFFEVCTPDDGGPINENVFYKFNRRIIGSKWEGLVITQLKQFFRKKENISKLLYLGGITCVYGLIFSFTTLGAANDFVSGGFKVLMVVFMGGMLYGLILGSFIFVGSKDLLWVYKRSPRNVNSLVYSYIIALLIINTILALVVTTFFTILFEFDVFYVVVFFIAYLSYGIMVLIEAIGIQGFSPAFEEKGKHMGFNMFKLMSIQMGVFMGFIFLMIWLGDILPELIAWELIPTILFVSIHLVISLPLFFMGLRHLKKIE